MTKTTTFALALVGALMLSGAAFAQQGGGRGDGGGSGGGGGGGVGGVDGGDPLALRIAEAANDRGRIPRGRPTQDRDHQCVTQALRGDYSDGGSRAALCPQR